MRLRQIQVDNAVGGITDSFAFVDDSDDEESASPPKQPQFVDSSGDEDEVAEPVKSQTPAKANEVTELDDDDESEDSEEEEAPPPPVKKRVVKRKPTGK